jgi:hypothetical protein
LVGASSLIAVVVPGEAWGEMLEEKGLPITVWPLDIEEIWYREPIVPSDQQSVTAYSPGGQNLRTGETVFISDVASFVPGVRTLVFLYSWQEVNQSVMMRHFRVVGEMWGVATITEYGILEGSAVGGDSLLDIRARIAEIILEKSPTTLYQRADAVVEGRVKETSAHLGDFKHEVKRTHLTVARWIKGKGRDEITILSGPGMYTDLGTSECSFVEMEGSTSFCFCDALTLDGACCAGPMG